MKDLIEVITLIDDSIANITELKNACLSHIIDNPSTPMFDYYHGKVSGMNDTLISLESLKLKVGMILQINDLADSLPNEDDEQEENTKC